MIPSHSPILLDSCLVGDRYVLQKYEQIAGAWADIEDDCASFEDAEAIADALGLKRSDYGETWRIVAETDV